MTPKNIPPGGKDEGLGYSYTGDGVRVHVYSDGSGPSLNLFPVGTSYSELAGVNERLYARDRREGRGEDGKRSGPTNEDLLLNKRATRLHYSRNFHFCEMPFHVIDGDMGRLFPPQAWAEGVLPIIPVERVFAFCERAAASPMTPRTIFEYDARAASTDPRVLRACLVLLVAGWKAFDTVATPWTSDDLRATLGAMGLVFPRSEIAEAARVLSRDQIVGTLTKPGLEYKHRVEHPEESVAFLQFLWSAFEPYVSVPTAAVRFAPTWWNFVSRQGWGVPVNG